MAPLDGRFVLEKKIGAGGMASVHLARDLATGHAVAVKRLLHADPVDVRRFAQEAAIMRALDHPAIVRWIAHGELPSGEMYLVMEWLSGEDLRARLKRQKLDLPAALALGARVASALGALHERGVVHRDIKPANLFLCDGDPRRVKLIDFGVARWSAAGEHLTARGVMLGTPGYMAPEQVHAGKRVDGRTDLFSLGVVLFQCLTGSKPFAGTESTTVLAKVVLSDAPGIRSLAPEAPEALERLVALLLAKRPEDRPSSGAAVAEELSCIARSLPDRPGAERAPQARPRSLRSAEQRFVTVLIAGTHLSSFPPSGSTPKAREPRVDLFEPSATSTSLLAPDEGALKAIAESYGAALSRLVDGSLLVHMTGPGAAADHALQMARCALSFQAALPRVPMGLATARAFLEGDQPAGDAIERAAERMRAAERAALGGAGAAVLIDQPTEMLVMGRFAIDDTPAGRALSREGTADGPNRWLLGRPQTCFGRDREIEALIGAMDAAHRSETPQAVLVIGEAGSGKSRLRAELVGALAQRGHPADVWIARGDQIRAGAPSGMLRALLSGALRLHDEDRPEAMRRRIAARVAMLAPPSERARMQAFLGEIVGALSPDEADPALHAARLDPLLLGDQTRRAFADLVEAACRVRRVVIVLEDLHWGDRTTVAHVTAALERRGAPLLVLALARPEIEERFPDLWREQAFTRMTVGPLDRDACEAIVVEALGAGVTREKVGALCHRCRGNPFFLEELIRAEVDGRAGTPDSVLALVEGRLTALPPDARRVLRAASVLGQVVWAGAVAALTGEMPAADRDALLASLVQKEWLAAKPDSRFQGERELIFRHALLQEAVYGTLTPEDRALGHRLAADWLRRAGEREAAVLAEHWERGGDLANAAEAHVRAAHQAVEANDWARARYHAERAERAGAQGELLGAADVAAAEAGLWSGANVEADFHARRALSLLPSGSEPWFWAARCLAEVSNRIVRPGALVELHDLLNATLDRGPVTAAQILAMARTSVQLRGTGHPERADALAARTEAAALRLPPDPGVTGYLLSMRAAPRLYRQDFLGFMTFMAAAADVHEEAGDRRRAATALANAAYSAVRLGQYARAEEWLRRALVEAERLNLAGVRGMALQNLAVVLAFTDRVEEAIAVIQQSVALVEAQNNQRLLGGSKLYLARILLLRGDLVAAEQAARESMELLAASKPLGPYTRAVLADISLASGRAAEARAVAEEGMRLLGEMGHTEDGAALLWVVLAESLQATFAHDAARRVIDFAQKRLEDCAATLSDPSARETFFTKVPENARTLAFARSVSSRKEP